MIATISYCTSASAAKVIKNKSTRTASKTDEIPGPSYAQRRDAITLAQQIAQEQGIDVDWVRQALAQAHYLPSVAKAVTPPAAGVRKNWRVYRSRFVEPIRIRAGVAFWQNHDADLQRAEDETGVPKAIIVGIIGVETIFGQHMGSYRVLDALATLALDFPASHPRAEQRSAYFRGELGQFLRLMHASQTEPTSVLGSYAGAIGLPQFMPGSIAAYALDFDADGRIDLQASPVDAIGSVANYLRSHGWVKDLPTHFPVQLDADALNMTALMAPDILPTFSLAEFQAKGALLEADAQLYPGKLALIELQNGTEPASYVAGTGNFYVITRYNWSSYYAMAVIELGQAVMQAYLQSRK
ncbi:MAG: lytic murein transglycosylase B [Rhodoferax sp.]|uniref:lytic murein transglycosylase B n=1 Tax=Rhodoferax sp. TaxID=50421 RepID=UPI001B3D6F13|nr:lytic murein transglycosylase B [Rhodoferax sp.]MBP9904197.1 lytic murein transglycosylase B [Rhodoferax sp.]